MHSKARVGVWESHLIGELPISTSIRQPVRNWLPILHNVNLTRQRNGLLLRRSEADRDGLSGREHLPANLAHGPRDPGGDCSSILIWLLYWNSLTALLNFDLHGRASGRVTIR